MSTASSPSSTDPALPAPSLPPPKGNKLLSFLHWRMRVVLSETRSLHGSLLAYDRHLNLVLADTEEVRLLPAKADKSTGKERQARVTREEKRALGLVLVRGEGVLALAAMSPPKLPSKAKTLAVAAAHATVQPVGRGSGSGGAPVAVAMSSAPQGNSAIGLSGFLRGVGPSLTPSVHPHHAHNAAGHAQPSSLSAPMMPPPMNMGRGHFYPSYPPFAPPPFAPNMPVPMPMPLQMQMPMPPMQMPMMTVGRGVGFPSVPPPPGFGSPPPPPAAPSPTNNQMQTNS